MTTRGHQKAKPLLATTPQALARQTARQAEAARTFAGVAPDATLLPLGKRQRTLARARLSLPYARALRVVARALGRRSGRVPLDDHTLAIVEAIAARFRAKDAAKRPRPEPTVNETVKRAVRAVAREPGVIVHRRQWDIRSRQQDRRAQEQMAMRRVCGCSLCRCGLGY